MGTVTSKDGTTIAFDRLGSGPAVILVDGALCYRAFGPMESLAASLEQRCTVFAYDRRGRGESGNTAPYAIEREIEDIEALIDAAGGVAGVYGISSGAALALHAASQLPTKVTKLAMYEAPYNNDEGSSRRMNEYRARLHEALAEGRRGDAAELFMRLVAGGMGEPGEMIASMRNAPVWPIFEGVAPTLPYDAAALGDGSVPIKLAELVAVPTLVMAGGASPEWMRQSAQMVAGAIPQGQYRTLEGQTHEVASEALAPVLVEFFAGS